MFARTLYTLLWWLGAPLILARLLWRARLQPEYLQNLAERIGRYGQAAPQQPLIWLHAVSVGETRAAQPLVRGLLERFPHHRLLLTQMTPTGRATALELYAQDARVSVAYLPYDTPGCVARFMAHFRPRLGILMETEIWPNLIAGAQRANVPVALVNARLSERSARGYAKLGRFARETFASLACVAAQSEADAARLADLGAKTPIVTGNLKFEITPPAAQLERSRNFRRAFGTRPVVLIASSREGEEAALLDAFVQHAPLEVLLVLVPRHPQRFDAVAELIRMRKLPLQRRSDAQTIIEPTTRVFLGDSMGEMFAYYAAADIALIGGSWEPLGGQNLIEACAVGTPVLVGPHTFNFAQATEQAIAAGAARRCPNSEAGVCEALTLLRDASTLKAMGDAGRLFANAHRGALAHTMQCLAPLLENQVAPR
ncbi:MAG: lipid IV(A) 3-deoxy-D-manno-octulosonic acid transferase [Betaproteobacteria bacterium]|nr:lipid IV(A) 3-deoxy-D-manno-octulosonic acid transferase [Betaproteobacteria bacterium]